MATPSINTRSIGTQTSVPPVFVSSDKRFGDAFPKLIEDLEEVRSKAEVYQGKLAELRVKYQTKKEIIHELRTQIEASATDIRTLKARLATKEENPNLSELERLRRENLEKQQTIDSLSRKVLSLNTSLSDKIAELSTEKRHHKYLESEQRKLQQQTAKLLKENGTNLQIIKRYREIIAKMEPYIPQPKKSVSLSVSITTSQSSPKSGDTAEDFVAHLTGTSSVSSETVTSTLSGTSTTPPLVTRTLSSRVRHTYTHSAAKMRPASLHGIPKTTEEEIDEELSPRFPPLAPRNSPKHSEFTSIRHMEEYSHAAPIRIEKPKNIYRQSSRAQSTQPAGAGQMINTNVNEA